jgi:hypothetical protein
MNNRWRTKRKAKSFYRIVKEGLAKMSRNSFYGISPAPMVLTKIVKWYNI